MQLTDEFTDDQAILHACICKGGCTLLNGHVDFDTLPDSVQGEYLKFVMIADDVPATIVFIGPWSKIEDLALCG